MYQTVIIESLGGSSCLGGVYLAKGAKDYEAALFTCFVFKKFSKWKNDFVYFFVEVFICKLPDHHSLAVEYKHLGSKNMKVYIYPRVVCRNIFGQKFQKVENEENQFFPITSSKLVRNWFCKKHLLRNNIFHDYCFLYVL